MKECDNYTKLRKAELTSMIFKAGFGVLASQERQLALRDYILVGELADQVEQQVAEARKAFSGERSGQ